MVTDGHNHTRHFSPDAEQSIEELCVASEQRGLKRIAITEHYDADFPDSTLNWVFNIDEYAKAFPKWQASNPAIELLMGVEFGYQTHLATGIDELALQAPFDVVLLSNHLIRGEDIYVSRLCYEIPRSERFAEYVGTLAEMTERCNNFDVVAHYDYINRYGTDDDRRVSYDDCPAEFDRFLEALVSKEKALEINTKSIQKLAQKNAADSMPDPKIIRRYIDMGGKLITLGSDAHTPDGVGICFEETAEYLKSLGITETVYYKGHKPYTESL